MKDLTQPEDSYSHLRRRLRVLLASLEDRLLEGDRRLVAELIDANESRLALETMADALAEDSLVVEHSSREEIAGLAAEMGLSLAVLSRHRLPRVG